MTADALGTIGAVIGSLAGAIILLLRFLVASKDEQIKQLEEELRDVKAERDLFRSLTLSQHHDD